MKKMVVAVFFASVLVVPAVMGEAAPGRSIIEANVRVRAQNLQKTLNWLKELSVSEKEQLMHLVEYKLDVLAARIDSLKLQLENKLTPDQMDQLLGIKQKINDKIDQMRAMPADARKMWREQMKFKFDMLPQEIKSFANQVQSSISDDAYMQLKELQEKSAKFVEWFKSLPASDQEAMQQAITEKVKDLKERVAVLKQLGRDMKYQEIQAEVDAFVAQAKERTSEVKTRAIELYEKAVQELSTLGRK